MTQRALGKIKGGLLAIGICGAVAAGSLGFTGRAEARVNGGRYTDQAQICGWIQDRYDELGRKLRATTDQAAREKIFADITTILGAWREQGCDKDFGSIAAMVKPVGAVHDLEQVQAVGVLEQPASVNQVIVSQASGPVFALR